MSDAHIESPSTTPAPAARRAARMGWGRRILLGLALVSIVGAGTGCNRYGWELFRGAAEIVTAVAVTAAVLSWHDHHYHHAHCGHRYVVVDSRPVYHYGGRWEYYDHHDGRWYYYPDGIHY